MDRGPIWLRLPGGQVGVKGAQNSATCSIGSSPPLTPFPQLATLEVRPRGSSRSEAGDGRTALSVAPVVTATAAAPTFMASSSFDDFPTRAPFKLFCANLNFRATDIERM